MNLVMIIMFSLKDKFKFLDDGIDFPFYNDVPKLSTGEWLAVLISVILVIIAIFLFSSHPALKSVMIFLVTIIPALYICKGNYGLFFKNIRLKDIKTIILCYIGYMVYVILAGIFLGAVIHYPMADNGILPMAEHLSATFIATIFLQLMGEEFLKVFLLLLIMYAVYKSTGNREISIYVGIVGSLFIFGMAHYSAYSGRILQILLIQGIGSIFHLYAYMKPKNVIVSYILHLMIDFTGFILSAIHTGVL